MRLKIGEYHNLFCTSVSNIPYSVDVLYKVSANSDSTFIDREFAPIIQTPSSVSAVVRSRTPPPSVYDAMPSSSSNPSSSTAWSPTDEDRAAAWRPQDAGEYTGASWLSNDNVMAMIAAGMEFRVAVPSGRNGRSMAWTVTPKDPPSDVPPPPPGHVTVMITKKGRRTVENKRTVDLVTRHPVKDDVGQPVWLLTPWNGIHIGILKQWDINQTLTEKEIKGYAFGSLASIAKVNNAICVIETSKGTIGEMSNSNLVRISTKRLRAI